jgi:hypothetical protein
MFQFMLKNSLRYYFILISIVSISLLFVLFSSENIALAASKGSKISTTEKQPLKKKIEITGTILNIAQAKKYLNKNSHLVFYNISKGLLLTLMSDATHSILDSDLPKTSFSETGQFTFEIDSLEPGPYIIFIQPVVGFTTSNASIALVVDEKTKNIIEIKYPFETGDANKLELNNVVLKIP